MSKRVRRIYYMDIMGPTFGYVVGKSVERVRNPMGYMALKTVYMLDNGDMVMRRTLERRGDYYAKGDGYVKVVQTEAGEFVEADW